VFLEIKIKFCFSREPSWLGLFELLVIMKRFCSVGDCDAVGSLEKNGAVKAR
jgi:hypothetical protein